MIDCPICVQQFDDTSVDPCPCCQKRICSECIRRIRISHKVPSACPFCRVRWVSKRSEQIQEWRRRIQTAQQVLSWAETIGDDVSPVVALTHVALMGVWLWNNT